MKIIVLAVITCSLLVGCGHPKAETDRTRPNESPTSRFTFISAQVKNSEGQTEPTVFKLDTTTGDAWRYAAMDFSLPTRYGTNGDLVEEGWVPVGMLRFPDPNDETLQRMGFFSKKETGR